MLKTLTFLKNIGSVVSPPIIEEYPQFARIKHWHERFHDKNGNGLSYIASMRMLSGNPRLYAGAGGDPSVFQLNCSSSDRPVHMTPAIENWMFELLRESCQYSMTDDKVKLAYRNLTEGKKAYTNKTGWDNGYQSVILNLNMGKEPQKLQLTIANGATVKVLGKAVRRGGQIVYPIEVMDAKDPNTLKRTLKNSWWLMFTATNSTLKPETEGTVEPFPKLNDYDLVIPLLANGTTVGYVESSWIELLGNDIAEPCFPYYKTWVSEEQWKRNRGLL